MAEHFGACPYVWQFNIWSQLSKAFLSNRMSHAYLVAGASGVGKQNFCFAFAAFLLCESKIEADENVQQERMVRACGECSTCKLVKASSHPDLLQINTESTNSGSGQIKIDQIRQIVSFTEKTPQQGGYRVVILNSAQAMNANAANALLKRLEEPGEATVMFLLSPNVQGVLPTVRSRCQVLSLSLPPADISECWLSGQLGIDQKKIIPLLLHLAGGAPLTAMKLYQYKQDGTIDQLLQALIALSKGKQSVTEAALVWQTLESPIILLWFMRWIAAMIRFATTHQERYLPPIEITPMLKYVARKAGAIKLLDYYRWLLEQQKLLKAQINLNTQLLIESILARWVNLIL